MMSKAALLTLLPLLAQPVLGVCPGYNYAIGNLQDLGNGVHRWTVYNDGCAAVDSLTTSGNPCDQGIFSCSSNPILFNGYRNSFSGSSYYCRQDANSGSCGSDIISVCCRNDGNKAKRFEA